MNASTGLADFTGKWHARWPEWNIGGAFLPAAQRDLAFAWFALQQELTDAAWGGTDATPGLAKLAWWNEELQGWAKGARRHPLGERLQAQPAPWPALAASLRALQASRELPPTADINQSGMTSFALAVAQSEHYLFGPHGDGGNSVDAVGFDLMAERCLLHGDADEARDLLANVPTATGSTRPRRLHSAFLRHRLRQLAENPLAGSQPIRTPAPWRSLWLAWCAARGVG
jgi:hypothetical protein